jgi:hypothetical protein
MWEKVAKVMSKLPLMVFIAAILVGSFVVLNMPMANALTKRDCSYVPCYNNPTARLGNTNVCGDHMCAPGEWDKLQTALTTAQRGQQVGWTAKHPVTTTSNATAPTTTTNATAQAYPTPTPPTTGASSAVCDSIQSMLNSAGVSNSVTTKVMTDLGCS